ncbi:MAG: lipopolysaccharide kinase InaA family protein [Planctomycetota bacterium]
MQDTNSWVDFEKDSYRIHALAPFKRFRGLEAPWDSIDALEEDADYVAKATRSRTVIKLAAGQYGLPVEVYVKRYHLRTWFRVLLRTARKTRAREEFDLGWQLMGKGVNTPRPVWLAEGQGLAIPYSLLATESLPGAESAADRWLRCDNERTQHELLWALGQFTARLHDVGFYHDDYRAHHLLVFPDRPSLPKELYLIDLLGGSFPKLLSRFARAKNLYQMIRSFNPKHCSFGFTEAHRNEFLLAYAGSAMEATKWLRRIQRVGKRKGRVL